MLAILGLCGFAVASVFIIGDNNSVDEEQGSSTKAIDPADPNEALATITIDEFLDAESVRLSGTSGNDILVGNHADNFVDTFDGNDKVDTGPGDDEVHAGKGDDYISGGAGDDSLFGDEGSDTLVGEDGSDELSGGNGDDVLDSGADNDLLRGLNGKDLLIGGTGTDAMYGGTGDDVLIGNDDQQPDTLFGGSGDDYLHGGFQDQLDGGLGFDRFFVEIDTDVLITNFEPKFDSIEITYDSKQSPPELSVVVTDDVTVLFANDFNVARLEGQFQISSLKIKLVPN